MSVLGDLVAVGLSLSDSVKGEVRSAFHDGPERIHKQSSASALPT
jgi:hypothetical protein